MSDKELRLQVVFAALDKLTAPMKKIVGESTALGKAIQGTNDRLKELNDRQKDVGSFREMHAGLRETSTKLEAAQRHVAGLAQKIKQTENPTRAMTREFNAAAKAAGALRTQEQQQSQQLQTLRGKLSGAGIDTRELGAAQTWLKNNIALTNVELTSQQKRLAAVGAQQQRVANAKQHADKMRTVAGSVASAGIGATVAGAAVGAPLVKGLQEAKHYQTETARVHALGLGDKASNEAIQFSRDMKTFGTSKNENLELMRDGLTIFADVHHAEMAAPILAKMKFANRAMYGQEKGEENDRMFMDLLKVIEMRGGATDETSMLKEANYVQQVITATGGRVAPEHWKQFIQRGGVAAKVLDDEAFYYQQEPLIQEMGGATAGVGLQSAYQNLYQGKTTARAGKFAQSLGLLDPSKIMYNKIGDLKGFMPGALKSGDQFTSNPLEWLEKTLLPALAKKGITKEKDIVDAMGTLFSNRTAANYYAQMYKQRAQIHKNIKLNSGADNVESLEVKARNTAVGKEMEAAAKLSDLKLLMGEKIIPLYTEALIVATNALKGLSEFMERNPTTAKAMIVGFGALAAMLVVLGPLMLGLAALIGPYAMLHVMFAKMGIAGGVLTPILRGVGSAVVWLGRMLLIAGRALLMNPIGLAVTGIATSAYLIYEYWEPIKAFFRDLWDGITERFSRVWEAIKTFAGGLWADVKAAFDGGIGAVSALILNWSPLGLFYKAFAGVMSWFGIELPGKFSEFGTNIIQGLVNGISSGFGFLKDKIRQLGAMVGITFAKEQEIHSPSRVFSRFGGFITEGLALGIENGKDAPINQVSGMAKRLTQIGAGIAISAATMPAMAFDTRPPIAPRAAGGGMPMQGDNIQIIIQPSPGMDEQAIARAVAQALEQRDRQKSARGRSSLSDY